MIEMGGMVWMAIAVMNGFGAAEMSEPVWVDVGELRLGLDADSGGLRVVEYRGVEMLRATAGKACLLDVACPGTEFDPLRLGTRYSTGARIEKKDDGIAISWDKLGASRLMDGHGPVKATVRIMPDSDGRSLVLTATVENASDMPIPQVLFPDFDGLLPFAGDESTELRTCGFVQKPFVELNVEDDGRWYASRRNWIELKSGAYDKSMAARWLDFGSLDGGISLFPKLWSWGPLTASAEPTSDHVYLHLSQTDHTLRLMCEHRATIEPGTTWTSPAYVLTPHTHGWARGIEPFRAWIAANMQRPFPVASHLRNSLGFRSVWLAQQYADADPAAPTVVWRFNDLPSIADECIEHGLNEMVLWVWQPWEIPDQPSPELGTLEEFKNAVEVCQGKGVNVSLFVSVMTMLNPIPARYGWQDNDEFWGYHTDFVPMLRPYYGLASHGSFADQTNLQWQADIKKSLLSLIARGWPSITWDQAMYKPEQPNLTDIFSEVRSAARAVDPEATFAGEDLNNIDLDSRWLDYTWNWALYTDNRDQRALTNAYPAPRFNINVGTSPLAVKRAFMDHMFLNVMPSKPEGINGSAYIAEFPEFSEALKSCAALHKKFQSYFEDGVPLGDCILAEPCPEVRVNGYILPDRALIVMLNTSDLPCPVALSADVVPWLEHTTEKYKLSVYDDKAKMISHRDNVPGQWSHNIDSLAAGEFAVIEVVPM